jgi:hypothetical protein
MTVSDESANLAGRPRTMPVARPRTQRAAASEPRTRLAARRRTHRPAARQPRTRLAAGPGTVLPIGRAATDVRVRRTTAAPRPQTGQTDAAYSATKRAVPIGAPLDLPFASRTCDCAHPNRQEAGGTGIRVAGRVAVPERRRQRAARGRLLPAEGRSTRSRAGNRFGAGPETRSAPITAPRRGGRRSRPALPPR